MVSAAAQASSAVPAPAPLVAFDDAAILRAICGADDAVTEGYGLGCTRCPSFTGLSTYAKPRTRDDGRRITLWDLKQVWRGHFTDPGVEQAALSFHGYDCEHETDGHGGVLLVEHRGSSIAIVRYDRGFTPLDCAAGTGKGGRTRLFCALSGERRPRSGLVRDEAIQYFIVRDWLRPQDDVLGGLYDNADAACDDADWQGYFTYERRELSFTDSSGDGEPDARIAIEQAFFTGPKAYQLRAACDDAGPSPRVQLMFEQRIDRYTEPRLEPAVLEFTSAQGDWLPSPSTKALLQRMASLTP
jgi:hypothetical protein